MYFLGDIFSLKLFADLNNPTNDLYSTSTTAIHLPRHVETFGSFCSASIMHQYAYETL